MERSVAPHLHRVIGVPGVAFAAFNGIVGMGIFGMPGIVAGVLGPAAFIAYGVCLVLVALIGLCFAESGSRVQESGGIYAYAGAAFGPVVSGVAGALIVFANSVATGAALVRFFLDTLAPIWPAAASPLIGFGMMAALYALLVLANVHGARDGSRVMFAVSAIKLAPLLLVAIVGLFAIHPANLAVRAVPSIDRIGQGTLLLFFAFIGVESGSYLSGETRDPARTVPRAILLALGGIAILYIALQTAAQGVLGGALANAPAPLVDTARVVFGPWGAGLLLAATLLSVIGYIVTDMLSSPRVIYALAKAGQLPRGLAWVHPLHHTPAVAIALYPVAILAMAASGTFRQIAILGTSGTLTLYLIVSLGVLRLRAKGIAQAGTPFVAPGGPVVPIAATAIILWLLSTLSRQEMAATAAFVAGAAAIYAVRVHFRPAPLA